MAKPKKPPDENDKKLAQGPGYIPGKDAISYRPPASARRDIRPDMTAAQPKAPTAIAKGHAPPSDELQPPDFSRCSWRRLHCTWPPQLKARWLVLSWRARSLYGLLLVSCDRDGALHLGSMGLRAVCSLIGASIDEWGAIERPLGELCANEWAHHDEEGQLLSLIHFYESQKKTDTPGATRTRRWRENSARKTRES